MVKSNICDCCNGLKLCDCDRLIDCDQYDNPIISVQTRDEVQHGE